MPWVYPRCPDGRKAVCGLLGRLTGRFWPVFPVNLFRHSRPWLSLVGFNGAWRRLAMADEQGQGLRAGLLVNPSAIGLRADRLASARRRSSFGVAIAAARSGGGSSVVSLSALSC
jgi:hypothetical protein